MRTLAISAALLAVLSLLGALGVLGAPGHHALGLLGRAAVVLGAALLVALLPAAVLARALPRLLGSDEEDALYDEPFRVPLGVQANEASGVVSEGS